MKNLCICIIAGLLLVGCEGENKETTKGDTKAESNVSIIDAKGDWIGSAKDPDGVELNAKMTFKDDNMVAFSIKSPKREVYNLTGTWTQDAQGQVSMKELTANLFDESVNSMISDLAYEYTINFSEDSTFYEAFAGSYRKAVRFELKKK